MLAALLGESGCKAHWPASETFTDCDSTNELHDDSAARFVVVVGEVEGVSYREDLAPTVASCRDGSMIISNTWGWRRERLRIHQVVEGQLDRARLVVFSSVGEFGPRPNQASKLRLVCVEEADGWLWAHRQFEAVEVVGGGFAVEGSELDSSGVFHPPARSVRVRERGRQREVEAVLTSELASTALCG